MSDGTRRHDGCPEDARLAAFLEGRLVGADLAGVQRHVASCGDCLDVIAAGMSPATPAERGLPRPVAGPRFAWRRWAVAASVVLVGALAIGTLRSSLPMVAETVAHLLGIHGSVEGFRVRLGASPGAVQLEVRGVTTRDVRVGAVTATVALAGPLSGGQLVEHLLLAAPELDLSARDPALFFGSAAGRARALAMLDTARIAVDGGRVHLPGPAGTPLVLEELAGRIERENGGVRIALRGRSGGGTVDVGGTIAEDGRTVALTVGGRGLDAAVAHVLGTAMQGALDVSLHLRADAETWRADGRLLVRGGRVVDYGPARIAGAPPALLAALVAVVPELAGADLVFDEARIAFAWRRGIWRLPRVFFTSGGVNAGGRVRIDPTGTVHGRGSVRLPEGHVRRIEDAGIDLRAWRAPDGGAVVPLALAGSLATPVLRVAGP